MVQKMQDEIVASIEEHVQTVQISLNQILPTLFALRGEESKIIAVMSSDVDDLLYGYLPEGAEAMNSMLQQFFVGKEEHGTFSFCGIEFRQDKDFGIHVTAKDNTERVQPITYDAKHGLARKTTPNEVHQFEIRYTVSCLDRKTNTSCFFKQNFEDTEHFRKCLCSRLA